MFSTYLHGGITSEILSLGQIKEKEIRKQRNLRKKSNKRKIKERNLKIAKKKIVKAFEGKEYI